MISVKTKCIYERYVQLTYIQRMHKSHNDYMHNTHMQHAVLCTCAKYITSAYLYSAHSLHIICKNIYLVLLHYQQYKRRQPLSVVVYAKGG